MLLEWEIQFLSLSSQVHSFSFEISSVCPLKYQFNFFLHISLSEVLLWFLFVFLFSLLLQADVIYLSLIFFMCSSSHRINENAQSSMLASPLPPSFLDAYSLSLSSLGKNVFCIIINFLHSVIIIYSLEFFTSATSDGHSLEIEWQQVSSSLQDSSQYSGRFQ